MSSTAAPARLGRLLQPTPHSTSGTSHRRWYALCDTTTSRLTRRALPRPLRPNPTVLHRLHPVPRSAPHHAHTHVNTAPPSPCAACAALPTYPHPAFAYLSSHPALLAPPAANRSCSRSHDKHREHLPHHSPPHLPTRSTMARCASITTSRFPASSPTMPAAETRSPKTLGGLGSWRRSCFAFTRTPYSCLLTSVSHTSNLFTLLTMCS
jgi:hypothetical protein